MLHEETTGRLSADLLTPDEYNHFEYASQGQRFINFLIDFLLMRFVLSTATGYAVGYLLGAIAPDFLREIALHADEGILNNPKLLLLSYLIGFVNFMVYYTFCEKLFNGKTVGKMITGTRAVQADGSPLTVSKALLRSLVRLVPFEVFSGFSVRTWHDKWTDTMVIKSR